MVREPDATMQLTPQDNQLMSKHRVLSFKPQLRLEWRGQDGQNETEQPDHSASLGDSITSSTRMRFSVHTAGVRRRSLPARPCFSRLGEEPERFGQGGNLNREQAVHGKLEGDAMADPRMAHRAPHRPRTGFACLRYR